MAEHLFARLSDVLTFVEGPASVTVGHVAVFADGTGKVLADGGALTVGLANVVEDTSPQLGGNLDLNGFTVGAATAANLIKLNAITATAAELNFSVGVTSGIQAQIDAKQASDADLTSWAGVTRAANFDTFVATPSSANLRALLSDESGSGAAYFQGGDAGTPSALVLTNATGLPLAAVIDSTTEALGVGSLELGHATDTTLSRSAAGVLAVEGVDVLTTATGQPLDADLTSWAGVARAANFDAFVATPSSANLRALLTDESGTGVAYFAGGNAGTPSAIVLTNASGSLSNVTSTTAWNPAADDGAALGAAATRWSDLFLAEGGVINWDNGDYTLTQSGDDLFANRGSNQGQVQACHWVKLTSTNTLTSGTTTQPLFDGGGGPAGGALTLETGQYFFESILHITTMSATSGNGEFEPLGGGSATMTQVLFHAIGIDASSPLVAAAQTGTGGTSGTANEASVVTAATGTGLLVTIRGTFNITVAGTIIPSIDLVTAAAAVVQVGSYFCCWRAGGTGAASVGAWA